MPAPQIHFARETNVSNIALLEWLMALTMMNFEAAETKPWNS